MLFTGDVVKKNEGMDFRYFLKGDNLLSGINTDILSYFYLWQAFCAILISLQRGITMKNREQENQSEENQDINNDSINAEIPSEEAEVLASGEMNHAAQAENNNIAEKLAEANDKYLRLAAEFDNFRKRNARERLELIATAGEDVITGLLPVVDDFERALAAFENTEESSPMQEGIRLIYEKLMRYLESKGLQKMDVLGKDLDTDLCDAISKFAAPKESLKNKIIEVVQAGYMLNGKVIRHAKVVMGE